MKSLNIEGSIVALVTPFLSNQKLDMDGFDTLMNWHLASGTDGIVIGGTTGESPTLSEIEFEYLIKRAVSLSNGKTPIIVGTGSNSTLHAVEKSVLAQELGADALLVVSPYYSKPSLEGLRDYFTQIAHSVDIPVILYNHPGRTGINLSPSFVMELAESCKNIQGIKESAGSITQFADLIALRPQGFKVYSGDDLLTFSASCLGANGGISVIANIIPAEYRLWMQNLKNGNIEEARSFFYQYKKLMDLGGIETNPIPIKAMMEEMGIISGTLRSPLVQLSTEKREVISNELDKMGLLMPILA